MEITNDLSKMNNRRIGKTYNAAQFVKERNGVLICHNRPTARVVAEEYGIETMCVEDVLSGKLRANDKVTYYDQECLWYIETKRQKEIDTLQNLVVDANKTITDYSRKLADTQFELMELKDKLRNLLEGLNDDSVQTSETEA